MTEVVISGTGLFTPSESISNRELVESYNRYVNQFNHEHANEIAAGKIEALRESDEEFIFKASGIKNRYVMDKKGILDINIMQPILAKRDNDSLSIQAEMAVKAAQEALQNAQCAAKDIDMVLLACSNMQRAYPAMAVEVQQALGIDGFAFDMNVACSSATFAIQTAVAAIKSGQAKSVLIVNPEICTAHLNFKDRDCHFIFGDACTAMVIQAASVCRTPRCFKIIDTYLKTQFSNNIRNNFGFLSKCEKAAFENAANLYAADQLFTQQGRKVFKEVVPMVADLISQHLTKNNITPQQIKRLWLHQANANMNRLIAAKVLGFEPDEKQAPNVLQDYANTSSPGCVIAFHLHHTDLMPGDVGVLCSFGAGYSVGNIIVQMK